ncbi:hypothetical protein AAC387_Pa06g1929 [Persea americana]
MKETNKKDQKIKDMEMSKREMLWKFLGEKKCLGVDVTAVEISKTVGKYTACLETFIGKVNEPDPQHKNAEDLLASRLDTLLFQSRSKMEKSLEAEVGAFWGRSEVSTASLEHL